MEKSREEDCFLKSSCLVTDGNECRAVVCGVGADSSWGRIKCSLVTESFSTPLQDKLEIMTEAVGCLAAFQHY